MTAIRNPVRGETTPRRALILEETLRIVSERGYHGFGIQELADRCGLTKPGLLHHFGSKDQLLISLLNEVDAEQEAGLTARFKETFDRAATPQAHRETFRQSALAMAAQNMDRPELIRLRVVLRVEAMNPGHPAHHYFLARGAAVLERLAHGAATFSSTPQTTARLVLATISGLEEQWLREDGAFDLLEEWERALQLLLP
jgi:AcrR family transcriptional regulator